MVGYRQDRDRRGCYCPLQPALVETDALRRPGATTCATIGATTWCYNWCYGTMSFLSLASVDSFDSQLFVVIA